VTYIGDGGRRNLVPHAPTAICSCAYHFGAIKMRHENATNREVRIGNKIDM